MKWPKFQPLAVKAIIPIRPSSYMRAINSLTRNGFQTVILQTYSSIISLKWSSCQACALFLQSTHPTPPLLSPNWIFIPPSLLGKQFSWAEFIPVGVLISVIKYPEKKNTRLWLAENEYIRMKHKCRVVTRVQIARTLSKFRLSWISVMFFSFTLLTNSGMISLVIWFNKHL